MSAIARTNRLHKLVVDHVSLMQTNQSKDESNEVAITLLFEQLLCALVCEIADLTLPRAKLYSLDQVVSDAQQRSSNWILDSMVSQMSEPGHWLNQWRLSRVSAIEVSPAKNQENNIALINVSDISETQSARYQHWVNEFGRLLESARELNNQY